MNIKKMVGDAVAQTNATIDEQMLIIVKLLKTNNDLLIENNKRLQEIEINQKIRLYDDGILKDPSESSDNTRNNIRD